MKSRLVFLIDVDNTLLDHDRLKERVGEFVDGLPGGIGAGPFWQLYEGVRSETGIADLPETARRYGIACGSKEVESEVDRMLWEFPFGELVYAGVHQALRDLATLGPPVIVCDGNDGYQRQKLRATGIDLLVEGRIHVFKHKEAHVQELADLYRSDHYVMVDDKPRIHAAMRRELGGRVTTVLVKQGHYASVSAAPGTVDLEIASLAELATLSSFMVQTHLPT
jgi:FMN phosphatase YigB (HAD superfamily)